MLVDTGRIRVAYKDQESDPDHEQQGSKDGGEPRIALQPSQEDQATKGRHGDADPVVVEGRRGQRQTIARGPDDEKEE